MVRLEGRGEDPGRVDAQAGEQLGVGAGDPGGCLAQPVAVRVLADGDEDLADRGLDALQVDVVLDLDPAELAADEPGRDVVELDPGGVDQVTVGGLIQGCTEPDAIVVVGLGATDLVQFLPSVVSAPVAIRTWSPSPFNPTGWPTSAPLAPDSRARRRRPLPL